MASISDKDIVDAINFRLDDMHSAEYDKSFEKLVDALGVLHPDKEYNGQEWDTIEGALVYHDRVVALETIRLTLHLLQQMGTIERIDESKDSE